MEKMLSIIGNLKIYIFVILFRLFLSLFVHFHDWTLFAKTKMIYSVHIRQIEVDISDCHTIWTDVIKGFGFERFLA